MEEQQYKKSPFEDLPNYMPFREFVDFYNATFEYDKEKVAAYLTGKIGRSRSTPKAHTEIANWIEYDKNIKRSKRVLMGYRHLGKSYFTQLYIIWRLMMDPNWTVMVISAASGVAERNVETIRAIIEVNPLTQHLLDGDEGWQLRKFTVKRSSPKSNPSCIMKSTEGRITGNHADMIIADDIELPENVVTLKSREDIKKRVAEMSKISQCHLMIGTPHHEDSIYDYLDITKHYEIKKFPLLKAGYVIEDGKIISGETNAPEMDHDLEWARMQLFECYTFGEFESQYQLKNVKFSKTLIDVDDLVANKTFTEDIVVEDDIIDFENGDVIHYYIKEERIKQMVIAWDPAYGKEGGDESVLAVLANTYDGNIYLFDIVDLPSYNVHTGSFQAQCEMIIDTCRKYHTKHIVVEENLSPMLKTELRRVAKEKKTHILIKGVYRGRGNNKEERIARAIEPVCKVGRLYIHDRVWYKSQLKIQLDQLGYSANDDAVDALATALDELVPQAIHNDYEADYNVIERTGEAHTLMYKTTLTGFA
ncbi:phage terminase large subunit [Magnetovibrio sp. PR-2]|uniref:phage terminase large subunit n=1 Tax=Magnetovibrio sp. PR-2 TaxID=3120356 RepID=UPI002FCDF5BD